MMATRRSLLQSTASTKTVGDRDVRLCKASAVSEATGYFGTSAAEAEESQASLRSPTTAGACFRSEEDKGTTTADSSEANDGETSRQPVAQDPDVASFLRCVPSLAEKFVVLRKVGGGTFSTVYLAHPKTHPDQLVALKHIVPTSSPQRTENELAFLQQLGGKDNVVQLLGCVREQDHVVLMMPFVPHERFSDYLSKLSVRQVSRYMAELLRSLAHVHARNIVHRDVKPSNFLHDPGSKSFHLVDFGLAHEVGKDPLLLTINRPMKPRRSSSATDHAHASQSTTARSSQKSAQSTAASSSSSRRASARIACGTGSPSRPTRSLHTTTTTTATTSAARVAVGSPRKRKRLSSPELAAHQTVENRAHDTRHSAGTSVQNSRHSTGAGVDPALAAGGTDGSTRSASEAKRRRRDPADGGAVSAQPQQHRSLLARDSRPSVDVFSAKPSTVGSLVTSHRLLRTYQNANTTGTSVSGRAGSHGNNAGATVTSRLAKHSLSASGGSGVRYRSLSAGQAGLDAHLVSSKRRLLLLCSVGHKLTEVCSLCTSRPSQVVTRAGTPGFRAPEVLLKYPKQTTAVDMWAAGVIFMCLLSARYPFFKGQDDMTALAQIISIFGYEPCAEAFQSLGKQLVSSPVCPPSDLRDVCEKLRHTGKHSSSTPAVALAATAAAPSCQPAESLRRSPRKRDKPTAATAAAATAQQAGPGGVGDSTTPSAVPSPFSPLASDSTIQSLRTNFHVHVSAKCHPGAFATMATSAERPGGGQRQQNNAEQLVAMAATSSPRRRRQSGSDKLQHTVQVLLPPSAAAVQAQKAKQAMTSSSAPTPGSTADVMSPTSTTSSSSSSLSSSSRSRRTQRCPVCRQSLSSASSLSSGDGEGGDDVMVEDLCWCKVPDSAYDLLRRCLDLNPKTRITAADALQHPFIRLSLDKLPP